MLRYKGIHLGDPGTAKTGAWASVLDAGYRVIVGDFDHNTEVLRARTKRPDLLHVVPFGDDLELKKTGEDTTDKYRRTNKSSSVRQWSRFLLNGNEALGNPREWGPDTFLLLDTWTAYCHDAERLALSITGNKTMEGQHIGALGNEVESMLQIMCSDKLRCNVVVNAHLKLVAPKPESNYSGETQLQKKVKQEIASLQETSYYPNMPGVSCARTLAGFFSTALLFELTDKDELVIRTRPVKGYTVKMPVPDIEDKLPVATGLATIVAAFAAYKGDEEP